MTEGGGASTRGARWILAFACLLVWLTRMVLPGDLSTSILDTSWSIGLGYALERGWRAGIDYVFTFGPLGFFSTATYLPGLFWTKVLVWEGAFQLLAAVVLTMAGAGIQNRLLRVLWFLLIVFSPLQTDAHAFLTIAAALAWIARRGGPRVVPVLICATVLAGLSLVKFTYTAAAVVCVLAVAAILWRAGARRAAAAFPSLYLALTMVAWWLCGQSLFDFPTFLARSVELSGAYSEAMSMPAPPGAVAVATALLGVAAFAAWLHGRDPTPGSPGFLSAGANLVLLWIAYKAGFVRAVDHPPIFFLFATIAPLLLDVAAGPGVPRRKLSAAARLACMALGVAGIGITGGSPTTIIVLQPDPYHRVLSHVESMLHPTAYRARLAETVVPRSEPWMDQPRLKEIVGTSSIDMISYLQVILFEKGLNWRPRPVLQSYATLTPALLDLNARHFDGDAAPEFVLSYLHSIDSRLGTLDDAKALQIIARDYEPVARDLEFLLLRRHPRPGPTEAGAPLLERTVGFGETVELGRLDGRCHLLALDIRYTLAGRLLTMLDAAPRLFLEVELDDGQKNSVRIVPGMIRTGAIFDPLIQKSKDWVGWFTGKRVPRPLRFRVVAPSRQWMYEPGIGVRITRADGIAPQPRPNIEYELLFSIFAARPAQVVSSIAPARAVVFDKEVVTLSTTSEMAFEVPAGKLRFSGRFAVSVGPPPSCPSEGIVFGASLEQPGKPDKILFMRHANPRHAAEDRRMFAFDLPFESESPGRIVLRAQAANPTDPGCDLACWTGIRLE